MSAPTIGTYAFSGTSLTSLNIPDQYGSIGIGALADCLSLGTLTLGNGITVLPANLTTGSSVQNVTVGTGVTSVDSTALPATLAVLSFSGDATNPDVINALVTILSTVTVTTLIFTNPAMTAAAITDAAAELEIELTLPPISQLTLSGTVVTGYTGTMAGPIVIPEGITEIADNAFEYTEITSVKLPNSLEVLGNNVFYNCSSLTEASLGTGLTTIGNAAFVCCTALKSIVVPASVTTIGWGVFQGCSVLESADISQLSITSLTEYLFYGCMSLKSIMFPPNLTEIAMTALAQTGLLNVVIPDTVTSIGTYAFAYCSNLTSVTLPPSGLATIPEAAFLGCSSLQTVKLGTGITTIGVNAFSGCSSLAGFIHSDGSFQTTVPASVTTIDGGAFGFCGFKKFTIPSTVTTLGVYIFYYCTLLKSATLNITEIPNYMFYSCQSLKEVIFKEPVTLIGQSAFDSCTSLTTFEFPNTLQTLHWYAFNGAGLTSITLPNSLLYMNPNVFANCASLTDINFGTGLTEIVEGTFAGCTALSNVTLPSLITSILAYGFADCTNLTRIDMPGVTSLGFAALHGCTSLTQVILSQSMTSISMSRQFGGCTSLTTLPTNYPSAFTDMNSIMRVFEYGTTFTSLFPSPNTTVTMNLEFSPPLSDVYLINRVAKITLGLEKRGWIYSYGTVGNPTGDNGITNEENTNQPGSQNGRYAYFNGYFGYQTLIVIFVDTSPGATAADQWYKVFTFEAP